MVWFSVRFINYWVLKTTVFCYSVVVIGMWSCRMVLFPQPAIYRLFSHFNPLPPLYRTLYTVNYTHTYIYLIIFTVNKVILNILLCMYMYNVHVLYSFFKSSNYSTWYFLTVLYLPFTCMGSLRIWEVSQIFFIKNNPAHLAEVPQGDST